VLLAVNLIFVPRYSYVACAWGGFAGYFTCMILSYIIGQKKNPIKYPLLDIALYTILAIILFFVMRLCNKHLSEWQAVLANTLLLAIFVAYILKKDLPLASLPVIGKRFRKNKS
jgi:peptidoglycan biosynthesis protein MviN/MurJ (putative lipid II flippase)